MSFRRPFQLKLLNQHTRQLFSRTEISGWSLRSSARSSGTFCRTIRTRRRDWERRAYQIIIPLRLAEKMREKTSEANWTELFSSHPINRSDLLVCCLSYRSSIACLNHTTSHNIARSNPFIPFSLSQQQPNKMAVSTMKEWNCIVLGDAFYPAKRGREMNQWTKIPGSKRAFIGLHSGDVTLPVFYLSILVYIIQYLTNAKYFFFVIIDWTLIMPSNQ